MSVLSSRVQNLKQSSTLLMAQKSRELKLEGYDVIDLSLGEPDFDAPEHLKVAAKNAIDEGWSHYSPVPGYLDLREAICHKLHRDNNLTFEPKNIVVCTGVKQALANLMLALVNPGDEVVVPSPYWVSYSAQIYLAQGIMVDIKTSVESDFKITPSQLEKALTDKTKLFLFSSPCNPTGSLYTKDELAALVAVFERYPHVQIISDEIYEYIVFNGKHETIAQYESLKDRVIVVNGLSKGFAVTGWRIGFLAAPEPIAKACSKIQGQFTSGANAIAQKAAIAAFTGPMDATNRMRDAFLKRRNILLDGLKQLPYLKLNQPEGAFFLFIDISNLFGKKYNNQIINDAADFSAFLLEDQYVSLVAGNGFGNPECIRLSYAIAEHLLEQVVERFETFLAKLT